MWHNIVRKSHIHLKDDKERTNENKRLCKSKIDFDKWMKNLSHEIDERKVGSYFSKVR